MNKTELIKQIAERNAISQRAAGAVLNAMLEAMTEALGRGDRVRIRGFGSLTAQPREPSGEGNPRTPRRTVAFKAAKALAEGMNAADHGPPRRHPRVPFKLRVESEHLESLVTEYTQNISKGGVFISSDRRLNAGSEMVFKLYVPMFSEPLTIKGRVAWVRGADQGSEPGMGVEFIYDLEEEEFVKDRIVEALIKRRQEP
jgi:type IV pilus assembly protein PilZ